jgi:hypothetical protein
VTVGILIGTDKTIEDKEFPDLRSLQEAVEGYIEPVTLSDGSTMWVNEEYRYQFGPERYNSIASDVAGLGGRPDLMLTLILGPVVIQGPPDQDGNSTPPTEQARRWVRRVAREA